MKNKKKKVAFIGNHGQKKQQLPTPTSLRLMVTLLIIVLPLALTINMMPNSYNGARSILSSARAALLPVKNFRFYEGKITDFLAEAYDLDKYFSIVQKDELHARKYLNAYQFIAYNTASRYFNQSALNTIWLSRQFQRHKNIQVAKQAKNWSLAFLPISYKEFFTDTNWPKSTDWNYNDQSPIPFTVINKGMPHHGTEFKIKRIFADGKVRYFVPKEPFIALLPNLWGNLNKSLPSLEPEEVLPISLIFASRIYRDTDHSWDLELLRNFLVAQYRIYAGIDLDPNKIFVKGKGIRSRFVYTGNFPKNKTNVFWYEQEIGASGKNKKTKKKIIKVPVPIVNDHHELCFFSSLDVSQSIIIPLSYLPDITNKDYLLASNGSLFVYDDVLEEMEIAKKNLQAIPAPLYPDYQSKQTPPNVSKISAMVTPTARHREIANKIISQAETYEEALIAIKSFFEQTLPYQTDAKELGWHVDINMTTLLTYINGGGDCEDHAIPYATMVMAADLPIMQGYNHYVGMHECYIINKDNETVGHINPLVYIPNRQPDTFPFPDHIKTVINGQEMNFFQIEATGLGEDAIGVQHMQRFRFESNVIDIISGVGSKRQIVSAGSNQFDY